MSEEAYHRPVNNSNDRRTHASGSDEQSLQKTRWLAFQPGFAEGSVGAGTVVLNKTASPLLPADLTGRVRPETMFDIPLVAAMPNTRVKAAQRLTAQGVYTLDELLHMPEEVFVQMLPGIKDQQYMKGALREYLFRASFLPHLLLLSELYYGEQMLPVQIPPAREAEVQTALDHLVTDTPRFSITRNRGRVSHAEITNRRFGLETGYRETLDAIATSVGLSIKRIADIEREERMRISDTETFHQYAPLRQGSIAPAFGIFFMKEFHPVREELDSQLSYQEQLIQLSASAMQELHLAQNHTAYQLLWMQVQHASETTRREVMEKVSAVMEQIGYLKRD